MQRRTRQAQMSSTCGVASGLQLPSSHYADAAPQLHQTGHSSIGQHFWSATPQSGLSALSRQKPNTRSVARNSSRWAVMTCIYKNEPASFRTYSSRPEAA